MWVIIGSWLNLALLGLHSLVRGFIVSGVSDNETDLRRLTMSLWISLIEFDVGLFLSAGATLACSSKLYSTRVGDLDAMVLRSLRFTLPLCIFWC